MKQSKPNADVIPETLYKYVPPSRIDILENARIRFTQPSALNDPFEFQPLLTAIAPQEWVRKEFDTRMDEHIEKELERLPDSMQKMVFESYRSNRTSWLEHGCELINSHQPTLLGQVRASFFEPLIKKVGVLSLSEYPLSMPMWAHYGDNHRGMLIGFDSRHWFFHQKRTSNDELSEIRKVRYVEQRVDKTLMDLSAEDVLYSKLSNWEYEKEWRLILTLHSAATTINNEIHLFDLPPDCIKVVVLGARLSDPVAQSVFQILSLEVRYRHVSLKRVTLNPGIEKACSIVDVPIHRGTSA